MDLYTIIFIFLSVLAIASAIAVITRTNPVYSAIALILNFLAFAGLFLLLNGQFIAILQILVYAGAIMVLFIFVIMLLNLAEEKRLSEKFDYKRLVAVIISVTLFFIISYVFLFKGKPFLQPVQSVYSVNAGKVEAIGKALFELYLIPFEYVSLVLIIGILGAVILAKRKFE